MNMRESFGKAVSVLLHTLVFVLFTTGLVCGSVGRVRSAGPYVVNIASDGPDSDPTDGICHWTGHGCSLRAAIQQATYDGGHTIITFLGILANTTLFLDAAYGTIYWTGIDIVVNGETNNITVSGQNLDPGQSVFQISGNSNLIQNLTIRDAPQDGIQVGDFGNVGAGHDNTVANNYLIGNSASGVYVYGGSSGGGQKNIIYGNLIGMGSIGPTTCVPGEENTDGIYVDSGTLTTTIQQNIIVCNIGNGIYLYGASHTVVEANQIGNYGGNVLANSLNGIIIDGSNAQWNVIGGDTASTRNVISGNGWNGVMLNGAPYNEINSNLIGLSANGLSAIPNQSAGVAVVNHADHTDIGHMPTATAPLFISGNLREGIYIADSSYVRVGYENEIGRNTTGDPLGNVLEGIKLDTGVIDSDINPNWVSYNGGAGISAVTKNQIKPYNAFQNGGLPIDLGNDGPTPNDAGGAGLGPDGWLDYPVITSVNGQLVTGISCPDCDVRLYQAAGNPAANGGGGVYIGWTDANGSGVWTFTMPVEVSASQVTMIAWKGGGVTGSSEMSPRPVIFLPIVRKN